MEADENIDACLTTVILTCNRSRFLQGCLESVRRQAWADWELVVSDCSDSEVHRSAIRKMVHDFASSCPTHQIKFLEQPKRLPQALHLEEVLREVESPLVALLDDDDEWLEDHLDRAIAALREDPTLGLCLSNGEVINELGNVRGTTNDGGQVLPGERDVSGWLEMLLRSFYGSTSSYVFRRETIRRHQFFDNSGVDLQLSISILLDGWHLRAFPVPSYRYRIHSQSSYAKGRQVVLDRHAMRLWLFWNRGWELSWKCPKFVLLVVKSFMESVAERWCSWRAPQRAIEKKG